MTEERDSGREERASDVPVDLAKEREAFVRSFLRKSDEHTEELLAENVELRSRVAELEELTARLRAQVASDDAIKQLLETVDQLEAEKRKLLDRSKKLERSQEEDENRYEQVEAELNDLANLYIASYQLHAGLSVRRVVRHLKDTIGQLVGAHAFVIYVVDRQRKRALPIGFEGLEEAAVSAVVVGEGHVGEACVTGIERVRQDISSGGSLADPLAVIPLLVEGTPIGAVAIVELLEQKTGWASVDKELFKLLGAHAGTALIAANQFAGTSGPEQALDGLFDNLVRRSEAPPAGGDR